MSLGVSFGRLCPSLTDDPRFYLTESPKQMTSGQPSHPPPPTLLLCSCLSLKMGEGFLLQKAATPHSCTPLFIGPSPFLSSTTHASHPHRCCPVSTAHGSPLGSDSYLYPSPLK